MNTFGLPGTSMVSVSDVRVKFGQVQALAGVSLTVAAGEVRALLGPNGAGKTTLVNVVSTLLAPDSGTVTVAGFDASIHGAQVRSRIGLAGQYAAVDELLTGRENLEVIARLYGLSRRDAKKRAQMVLERLSLSGVAERQVRTYSGGMRRRIDLGGCLVGDPQVLILDEPTTGLDPRTRLELWDFLRELVEGGTTVLLTTQYLHEADELADTITVLDHGEVIAEGSADQLKSRVGGATLVVVPSNSSDAASIAKAIGEYGSLPARHDEARGAVVMACESDSQVVVRAANALSGAGLSIKELSLNQPTLDEVFLRLTKGGVGGD